MSRHVLCPAHSEENDDTTVRIGSTVHSESRSSVVDVKCSEMSASIWWAEIESWEEITLHCKGHSTDVASMR